jgi:acyl-CoA synthetase (AMP-forming)/AMP-acid ligase II
VSANDQAVSANDQSQVRCGGRSSTYPQLFGRALRATSGMRELGVGAGDRVALLLRNSLEFLEASIATVPLAASAVPINWPLPREDSGKIFKRRLREPYWAGRERAI